jgi:tRNA(Ile)-lysidine synthase
MSSTRRPPAPERRLEEYLRRHGIPAAAPILVAFSGGPDSRALLGLLAGREERRPLHAAYLDHGLRSSEERAEELAFVRRTCAELGMPLRTGALPPGQLRAESRGRSLEQVAREHRYRFLRKAAEELGCSYIALGHTADDQAETLIMRFFQGVGPGGLRGIPERRGCFLRPLLECGRAELQAWLGERGLEYRTDSSNLDPVHLRNAVRLLLQPVLARLFPGYRGSLAALAATMRGVQELLEREAAALLPWARRGQGFAIDAQAFLAAPAVLRRQSLFAPLQALGVRGRRLPARFFSGLGRSPAGMPACNPAAEPGMEAGGMPARSPGRDPARGLERGRTLLAGRGVRLRPSGGEFVLERDIVGAGKKGYLMTIEPRRRYTTSGRVIESDAGAPGEGWVVLEARPEFGPLVVRSATAADRLRTEAGSTAVSKLCSAWRIPLTERWKLPIVADRHGVLAVLGGGQGGVDRFRPGALIKAGGLALRIAGLEVE